MNSVIIERFGVPSKMDTAPYKSICKVKSESHIDVFVQSSKDEEVPSWEHIVKINHTHLDDETLHQAVETALAYRYQQVQNV